MKPVPDNWSCSFCWPPMVWDGTTYHDTEYSQWYTMTYDDARRLDESVSDDATHAERLAKVAELEKQGKAESQRFGNFIHIRLKLGE